MLKTTTFLKTENFTLAVYQKGSLDSKKLALVLPGRLDTKDYPHMHAHVDFLATKEYLALSFDPPGTWESEGDLSIFSTTNYLQAIKELIEYYGKPTLLVGHSRGGGMAILAGTRLEEVEAFVVIMGRASYAQATDEDWSKKGVKKHVRDTPEGYAEKTKTFMLPYAFVEDSWQYDSVENLKTCKKPKLFVAGSKDDLVDPVMVKETYELSAEPKQFVLLDSVHDYRLDEKKIQKINELIGEFIQT